ncbi:MAG: hypothetical protein Q9212_002016 [Teloschistes hypoglaucus]
MDEDEEPDGDDEALPELQDLIPSPPKKRQRFNPAQNTLYRPFKTPLKTSNSSKANVAASSSPADSSATPSAKPTETPKFDHNFPTRNTPRLIHNTRSSPTKSPHLDQLQKKHTALLNELSSLRASLETTNQALEIESSSTDAELEGLIRKWRSASNDAAEEVFGIMKERVDGMGGYKAWRAKEKDRAGREDQYQMEDPDDDEGFTMEKMLKSLGIPLDKINYDRESL